MRLSASGLKFRFGLVLAVWALSFSSHAFAEDLGALMRDDKQWVMAAKNYANTRFSSLDQINKNNANQLKLAWTFSVGANRGQEAAPLIVDGVLYIVGPY